VADLEFPREPLPRLVLFDLDGTITRRDTLSGYVFGYALRQPWRLFGFILLIPAILRFCIDRDRGRLKGRLIAAVMGGSTEAAVAAWTERYIPKLLARGVFSEARQAIEQHRKAGDHLVLMSATVDLYVPGLAAALGFNEWVCSRVRWNTTGRLEGELLGANVRGAEKARHLKRLAAAHPGKRIVAYGNSDPDLPHLRLADQAILINPSKTLMRAARDLPVLFKVWL
jgi:phosphatidylglycerophosphatase C